MRRVLAARFPALPVAPFVTARDTSTSEEMPLATPHFRQVNIQHEYDGLLTDLLPIHMAFVRTRVTERR
jgi:hypothetical protein